MFTGIIIYYYLLNLRRLVQLYLSISSYEHNLARLGHTRIAIVYYLFSFFPRRRQYNRATGDRYIYIIYISNII